MDQKHITSLAQPLALFSGAQPLAPPHIAYLSHSFMINVKSMIIAFPTTLLKHHNTMGSDDYAAVGGGGALKLKGAKIHKKKKKRDKTDLEKNLDTGNKDEEKRRKKDREEQEPHDEDDEDKPEVQKTEAQKRHEEIKKKRLLKLAESSSSRPELLKTHKERVEELNTYLSRLSEHHDMPRIGPG
ncbi:hypothetical protein FOCG_06827 [Fusarium oxysporum f. sp. radicis-lycopersici 26381]|uniref:DUF1754-domain-containing protein n=5 Tax=Fusarium oxysporum TaxID=5507 RepID=A0A420QH88_FUSOX|nr:hypothetical protein FOWG_06126 [Fusarium oxysporum f. sp. lycopersici MN25]EXL53560.1 hypothetical protein FOCG_06827 [Fusarium oxysporum f. sp. radicis-lycopersici 26381]RKK24984.1 hypothetical protein BFJ65_g2902 [Fusarium oxysporum f. sp. cepae]RKL04168.1 hypothetical protein BFJ68_g11151 [Fusarium oxysporum]RKK62322.1 hypothetical protein BFJ67_g1270 [Fusarium oxysporum f. sp. cepae]